MDKILIIFVFWWLGKLKNEEQSRRDDLESLGYILLYFCLGTLPWQGLRGNTKEAKYKAISDCKARTSIDKLCENLPSTHFPPPPPYWTSLSVLFTFISGEFANYITEVRALKFTDKPDYVHLRKIFRDLFIRKGYVYDCVYDWTIRVCFLFSRWFFFLRLVSLFCWKHRRLLQILLEESLKGQYLAKQLASSHLANEDSRRCFLAFIYTFV